SKEPLAEGPVLRKPAHVPGAVRAEPVSPFSAELSQLRSPPGDRLLRLVEASEPCPEVTEEMRGELLERRALSGAFEETLDLAEALLDRDGSERDRGARMRDDDLHLEVRVACLPGVLDRPLERSRLLFALGTQQMHM